jgi:HEAT repeat protein
VPRVKDVPLSQELQAAARREVAAALASHNPMVRTNAIEAITMSPGDEGGSQILLFLDDPAPVVRFAALVAAGRLRLPDAKAKAEQLANDSNKNVQVAARFALHRLGDYSRSHDLEKTSQDGQPQVRANTAMVLGLLEENTGLRVLRGMAGDKNPAVRLQVAEARWRLGDEAALETLVSGTISAYPDDQMLCLMALASTHNTRVREHVRGALVTDYQEVNLVAARAMGMLSSDEGYGVAINGARSKDPAHRQLAALAFGAIARRDAQDILAKLLQDHDETVRLAAAVAILQLN